MLKMNKYSIMVCNAYFLKDKILANDFKQKIGDLLTYMYEFIVVVCSFFEHVYNLNIFLKYIYIYISI